MGLFASEFAATLGGPGDISGINPGASNQDAGNLLRKFLNPALQGRAWDALCYAIGVGEQYNVDNARLAFDQLFKCSASGIYLDRQMADVGLIRPFSFGLTDQVFRKYGIAVTNNKVTEESVLEVTEVFYGEDAVRANSTSGGVGPYAIFTGDDFSFLVDEKFPISFTFSDDDMAVQGVVTAAEVAAAITRAIELTECTAWAVPIVDAQTGTQTVRIFSGSRGLASSIRVTGGKAQNVLLFDQLLDVYQDTPVFGTWTVVFDTVSQRVRFTTVPANDPQMNEVRVGDYVNIYGPEFHASNRGSFPIVAMYVGASTVWFEIVNADGYTETVAQLATDSLNFFRPVRKSTHSTTARDVVVSQPVWNELDVVLPATSQAVTRAPLEAAYLQPPTIKDCSLVARDPLGRVTVTCPSHGLAVGDWFMLSGVYPDYTVPPYVGADATHTSYNPTSILDGLDIPDSIATYAHAVTKLLDETVIVTGGISVGNHNVHTLVNVTCEFAWVSSAEISHGITQWEYSFISGGVLPANRIYGNMSTVDDGTTKGVALFSGGCATEGGNALTTAYLYSSSTWSATGSLNTARANHGSSSIIPPGGDAYSAVLVTGGINAGITDVLASCERFSGSTWTTMAPMTYKRCDHVQLTCSFFSGAITDQVVVIGGRTLAGGGTQQDISTGTALNSCEVYDAQLDAWSPLAPMTMARVGHRAVQLSDGRIFVAGGYAKDPTQSAAAEVSKTCEIYDPAHNRWYSMPSMGIARYSFAMFYLPDREQIVAIGPVYTEVCSTRDFKWHLQRTADVGGNGIAREIGLSFTNGNGMYLGGAIFGRDSSSPAQVYIPNSDTIAENGFNDYMGVVTTVVDADNFQFEMPDHASYASCSGSGMTMMPMKAEAGLDHMPGPFAFDTTGGFAVTATETTTTMSIAKGHQYESLTVADASLFPDEPGYLVLSFGFKEVTGPVKYLGRISSTELMLDFSFRFPTNLDSGVTCTLLLNRGAYVPENPEEVGSFYLTASAAGRVAAEDAVDAVTAAGVKVVKTILYPGDRGLGNEGEPVEGSDKLSDIVEVFGGDNLDDEIAGLRNQ